MFGQECWTDTATDRSIVVEILAYNEDASDTNCAQFYWEDNAQCNDAEGQYNSVQMPSRDISEDIDLCSTDTPDNNSVAPSCWVINGVQHVAKFKECESARNTIAVHLAVIRLPNSGSDVVVHFNQPLELSVVSSSAAVARASDSSLEHGAVAFAAILRTLRVHDWGLFSAPEEEEEH